MELPIERPNLDVREVSALGEYEFSGHLKGGKALLDHGYRPILALQSTKTHSAVAPLRRITPIPESFEWLPTVEAPNGNWNDRLAKRIDPPGDHEGAFKLPRTRSVARSGGQPGSRPAPSKPLRAGDGREEGPKRQLRPDPTHGRRSRYRSGKTSPHLPEPRRGRIRDS